MKILLLGANGQLGRSFINDGGLAQRGELILASRDGHLVNGLKGEVVDLSLPDTLPVLLDRVHPTVILNTAAYTAVDLAEQEESLAMLVNGQALNVIGAWAARHNALCIHYSTDYVFDGGSQNPYAVDAATAPVNAYGRSKLAGENALRDSGAQHLILRTAWVYAPHGNNFLRTILRLSGERDELRIVADQWGAPTDTSLIVRGTLAALDAWLLADTSERRRIDGVHHLVASGETTWHGFASEIVDQAFARGLISRRPKVVPIASSEFPTLAKRPASSRLDNTGFQENFGFSLPDWQQRLSDVILSI